MPTFTRTALVLSLGTSVCGWVTRSQSVYGAQVSEIKDLMNGLAVDRETQAQLGYLWTMPDDVHSTRGLGGGITWAWNPVLCDLLMANHLFREDIPGTSLVGCPEFKAAVARAFDNWSANNRYIKFQDVTRECELAGLNFGPPTAESQSGQPHGGCPLAEIWVTSIAPSVSTSRRRALQDVAGTNGTLDDTDVMEGISITSTLSSGVAVATATSHAVYSSNFRYTNGMRPFYADRTGSARHNRRVVETVAGTFAFNADPSQVCWYMDSYFCSGIHDLKATLGGATNAKVLIQGAVYGLMMIGIAFYLFFFGRVLWRAYTAEAGGEDDVNADDKIDFSERIQAGLRAITHWNPATLTFFVCLLYVPPLISIKIFEPCFDCYDFEAAALHEIGHFLGLGHLDNIPNNWAAPTAVGGFGTADFAGPTPGENVYQQDIAAGMQAAVRPTYNCTHPFDAVYAGTPPGAATFTTQTSPPYQFRDAQMEARTQHNPSSCLFDDDLEALATLYPDCGDFALTAAVCHENAWNLGYVRIAVYVLMPLVFTLLGVILFSTIVHIFERRERERLVAAADLKADEALARKNALKFQLGIQAAKHRHSRRVRGKTPSTFGNPMPADRRTPGGAPRATSERATTFTALPVSAVVVN